MNWGKRAMEMIVVRVDVVFLHSRSSGVLHSVDWWLVTFRYKLPVPSSRVKQSARTLKTESKGFPRNVSN